MPSPRGARGDGERGLDRDRYKRPVRLSRSRSPVNTHRRSRSPRRNSSPARRISRSPARRERSPPRRRPRSRSPPSPRKDGESVDKEVLSLQADEVAYLLGRDGTIIYESQQTILTLCRVYETEIRKFEWLPS